jgi:phospholipase C
MRGRPLLRVPLLLVTAAAAAAAAAVGCAGAKDRLGHSALSEDDAARLRGSCRFSAGTPAGESLPSGARLASEIPLDVIVVLTFENRSFDHLLAGLGSAGVSDIDLAADDAFNLDPNGERVERHPLREPCFADTRHGWDDSHREWNGGRNDGFVAVNAGAPFDPLGHRAMGYYGADVLPYLDALAADFAVGDRYFSSMLGPTNANRAFLYAASSFGATDATVINVPARTIFDALDEAGVAWAEYHESLPESGALVQDFIDHLEKGRYPELEQFFTDARAGTLPSVVWIDGADQGGVLEDDFHPPADVEVGQAFLARIVGALVGSPQWARTALFINFDEHGGLYDHVPPPPACPPDARLAAATDGFGFDRLGFRVPFIAVSPYARRHHVSHSVYDHTSILRFIEARFGLAALTARDANADPPYDLFDFGAPPALALPPLPTATVSGAAYEACRAKFGG